MKITYKTIIEESAGAMDRKVQEMRETGWELHGEIHLLPNHVFGVSYVQRMAFMEDDDIWLEKNAFRIVFGGGCITLLALILWVVNIS